MKRETAPTIHAVRRRRECKDCGGRFTTFETVIAAPQIRKDQEA